MLLATTLIITKMGKLAISPTTPTLTMIIVTCPIRVFKLCCVNWVIVSWGLEWKINIRVLI